MREEIVDGNDGWPDYHDSHRRKNAKHQGWHKLNRCLSGPFFSLLPALCSQRIREGAQRFGDRSSEAIGLNKHGYERAGTFEIRPHCKRLPCCVALNPCPLFEVDEQHFFTEFRVANLEFLPDPYDGLVHA